MYLKTREGRGAGVDKSGGTGALYTVGRNVKWCSHYKNKNSEMDWSVAQ